MKAVITFWVIIMIFVALTLALMVRSANAADLKSVVIHFKSDKELRQKTEWFINSCDTVRADTSDGQIAYVDSAYYVGFQYTWEEKIYDQWRTVTQTNLSDEKMEYRYWPPLLNCRRFLSLEIYRMLKIPGGYYSNLAVSGSWPPEAIPITDTLAGGAILFYEEVVR